MVTKYYMMPKVGTGVHPGTELAPTESYAIRPQYADAVDAISPTNWMRKVDDPIEPNTSLRGSKALYAVVDAAPAVLTFLDAQADVTDLGDSPLGAAREIQRLAIGDRKLQGICDRYPTEASLTELLEIRRVKLSPPPGTDTTTWNDTDGTAWTALTANPLTQVSISGSNNATYDVLTNQGRATHPGGGAFFTNLSIWHQTTDNAEDQTVQIEHISGQNVNFNARIAGRVVVGDTDTFFHGQNESIAGNDTRLYESVNGTESELASSTQAVISRPVQMRLVIATNGANTDIDFDVWASAGSPPGTPQIQFSGSVNVALQGQSGHGAGLIRVARGSTVVVEDLAFTNNDVAASTSFIVPRRLNTLLRM